MEISLMQSSKPVSFKALPERHYPYKLSGEYESQAEVQMLKVREEMKEYLKEYERTVALSNLQNAIQKAAPYLPETTARKQKALYTSAQKGIDEAFHSSIAENLAHLILCSAQSAYQQDKHDAIYAFNLLAKGSFIQSNSKLGLLYGMANAFKNLDRKYDAAEISKAEDTLRDMYAKQSPVVQMDLEKLYGNGKNLDFTV